MADPHRDSTASNPQHQSQSQSQAAARPQSTATTLHQRTQSTSTTAPPRPPLTAHPTAVIADKAMLTGTHAIAVAANAIIHPFARLDSSAGPITIGESCVVWERAEIGGVPNRTQTQGDAGVNAGRAGLGEQSSETTLAAHVVVSPMARVGAGTAIGAYSTLDVGAVVGMGCTLGAWCRLAALTQVDDGAVLGDYAVLYFVHGRQAQRVHVSARDFEKVRSLEVSGREKERDNLVKTLAVAKTVTAGKGR